MMDSFSFSHALHKECMCQIVSNCLRLGRYDNQIQHVPGKLLYAADTLSHAAISESVYALELKEKVDSSIGENVKQAIQPTGQKSLNVCGQKQADDPSSSKAMGITSFTKQISRSSL